MIKWNYIFWMLVLPFLSGNAMAGYEAERAGQVFIPGDNVGLDVEVSYLREADRSLSIDEILKHHFQSQFLPGNQKKHLLSKSNSYWIKIRARRSIDSGNNYYLEVGFPTLDKIICYGVEGSEVISTEQSGLSLIHI